MTVPYNTKCTVCCNNLTDCVCQDGPRIPNQDQDGPCVICGAPTTLMSKYVVALTALEEIASSHAGPRKIARNALKEINLDRLSRGCG